MPHLDWATMTSPVPKVPPVSTRCRALTVRTPDGEVICSFTSSVPAPATLIRAEPDTCTSIPLTISVATLVDPVVEVGVAAHWLWTVVAVTKPPATMALATSAELLTEIPEPEPPPWVLTVRPLAVSRNGTETLKSDFVRGPPPPAGRVTEGVPGELIVRPKELAATCSPKAPPTSARTLLLTVDVLLARLGSGSLAFPLAVSVMVP